MPNDDASPAARNGSGTHELLALIDRLEELVERSDLTELEVQVGDTTLVLRTPAAVRPAPDAAPLAALSPAGAPGGSPVDPGAPGPLRGGGPASGGAHEGSVGLPDQGSARHAVLAPLTGVFYASPSPEAAPYVRVGSHVQVGQVIGLIEAMKLFNEIKSDASGTVTRTVAETGMLVKAKAPLLELQPA